MPFRSRYVVSTCLIRGPRLGTASSVTPNLTASTYLSNDPLPFSQQEYKSDGNSRPKMIGLFTSFPSRRSMSKSSVWRIFGRYLLCSKLCETLWDRNPANSRSRQVCGPDLSALVAICNGKAKCQRFLEHAASRSRTVGTTRRNLSFAVYCCIHSCVMALSAVLLTCPLTFYMVALHQRRYAKIRLRLVIKPLHDEIQQDTFSFELRVLRYPFT